MENYYTNFLNMLENKLVHNKITSLCLDSLTIYLADIPRIMKSLLVNNSLLKLEIRDHNLDEQCVVDLVNYLCSNTQLRKLVLSNIDIPPVQTSLIIKSLELNNQLRVLDLSRHTLKSSSAAKLSDLIKLLTPNNQLKILNLNRYKYTSRPNGAIELHEFIKMTNSLCKINLSHCSIHDDDIITLVEVINVTNKLRKLSLSYCWFIGYRKLTTIVNMLCLNNSLEELDLGGISVKSDNLFAIANMLNINTTLKKLIIGPCEACFRVTIDLAKSLRINSTLNFLELYWDTSISAFECTLEIAKSVCHSCSLTMFNMHVDRMNKKEVMMIVHALEENYLLTEIILGKYTDEVRDIVDRNKQLLAEKRFIHTKPTTN